VNLDEGARTRHLARRLGEAEACLRAKGSVTAGNSSQTSDGAGALIVASEKAVKQFDLKPLPRFVSFAVRGVPPEIMGIGPSSHPCGAAFRRAHAGRPGLDRAQRGLRRAGAGGHPFGRSGRGQGQPDGRRHRAWAIRLGATEPSALPPWCHALRRHKLKYGMVTMCVGMGRAPPASSSWCEERRMSIRTATLHGVATIEIAAPRRRMRSRSPCTRR